MNQIQWIFFDPSVLLNENGTERLARQALTRLLAARGRPVHPEQVERAWMQAIAATQPTHPLVGMVRQLAPEGEVDGLVAEVLRTAGQQDMLVTGVQLTLHGLEAHYSLGIIGPYRLPGTRAKLERFHLKFPVEALSDEQNLSHRLDVTGKVDPALFTWALRKAGIAANTAAFASDRVDLGLAPAKMAGLTTFWLRTTNYRLRYPRNGYETPDKVFNSLTELSRFLLRDR